MTVELRPLVSVLVPAHNAEATLAATLRSALDSSYSNLELVLVDDGSTDRTSVIADEAARSDERVRVFRQPHRGVSAALNRGLAEVRGEFVARLDADDLWHTSKLAKQVELIAADPAVALVYAFVRYVNAEGRVVADGPPQKLSGHALCQCLYEGIVGGGSSVLVRRSILEAIGGYEESLSVWEDLLMHLHAAAVGEIAFVPEYLVGYRVRAGSSSSNRQISLENWRRARRRIRADFPNIPKFVHNWSDARRLLDFALGFVSDGRRAAGAGLLAQALARDFRRTSGVLLYHLRRRLGGGREAGPAAGPSFAECDPGRSYRAAPIRALDCARHRRLKRVDEGLAKGLIALTLPGRSDRAIGDLALPEDRS